jgi:hypothetical protein
MDVWALRNHSLGIVADNWGKWLHGEFTGKTDIEVDIPAHGTVVHRWYLRRGKETTPPVGGMEQNVLRVEL